MVMVKGLSVSMNAKITGIGNEVVVLAHGYGTDQSIWDKVAPNLAQNYRVLTFDWNFSGAANNDKVLATFDPIKYSSYDAFADDLIDLMDEMSIKSCYFVGHSMSGMIGCIASTKRLLLFKKLILIGASPRYLNSEDYEGGFEATEIEQLLATIETNFQAWATAFAPLAVGGKDPLAAEKLEKMLQNMRPEIGLAVAKAVFLGDYRHVLEQVITPCTLICTTNDVVVPSSVPYYMQERMGKAKSRVEIIDVEGHFPQLIAVDQFLVVLARDLES